METKWLKMPTITSDGFGYSETKPKYYSSYNIIKHGGLTVDNMFYGKMALLKEDMEKLLKESDVSLLTEEEVVKIYNEKTKNNYNFNEWDSKIIV